MIDTAATSSLWQAVREPIAATGSVGFAEFMNAALYDVQHGYYANPQHKIGRSGDFFTSVSVGPLFGKLLAMRLLEFWRDLGAPSAWRVIEVGAHHGTLAVDVLRSLQEMDAKAFAAMDFVIVEPLAVLREKQGARLSQTDARFRVLPDLSACAAEPMPGVAYGNEVLDALPCHLLVRRLNRWLERAVGIRENQWVWVEREIRCPTLAAAAAAIEGDFPDGYRTELRTCFSEFLAGFSAALGRGLMIWIDYGFDRDDYYHPARCEGTLRTFHRHQAGDDPLVEPGSRDISAHVDFSALANAARDIGWQSMPLTSQGTWLTRLARPWLLGMEGRPDATLLRQFQSLTHPGQMGSMFHVLEMKR